jgi:hypothetical protein
MRAAARAYPSSVVRDVSDAFERHAEPFGDELGKARFVPLPRGHRAHNQLDPALRKHCDLGTLARRAAGDLDIIGDADATQLAAFPCFGAPGRKSIPIGERHRRVHTVFVATAVVGDAKRIGVGLGSGRDHVPAA